MPSNCWYPAGTYTWKIWFSHFASIEISTCMCVANIVKFNSFRLMLEYVGLFFLPSILRFQQPPNHTHQAQRILRFGEQKAACIHEIHVYTRIGWHTQTENSNLHATCKKKIVNRHAGIEMPAVMLFLPKTTRNKNDSHLQNYEKRGKNA